MVNACAMVEGENIPLARGRIGVAVPKKDEDRETLSSSYRGDTASLFSRMRIVESNASVLLE